MQITTKATGSALAAIASMVLVACDGVAGNGGMSAPGTDRPSSAARLPTHQSTSDPPLSARKQQAIDRAASWVASHPSSEVALIVMLQREGFTDEEARYAASHIGADYKAEAIEAAMGYLEAGSISEWMLIKTVEMDGYSTADALAAVKALHADWNAEAAEAAKEMVKLNPSYYTRSSLIDELMTQKFTAAQAAAGVTAAGL